jgi:hypothetical protein
VVAISMRSSPRVEYFVIHDTRARNTKWCVGKKNFIFIFNAEFNKTNNKMNSQRRTTHTAAL